MAETLTADESAILWVLSLTKFGLTRTLLGDARAGREEGLDSDLDHLMSLGLIEDSGWSYRLVRPTED